MPSDTNTQWNLDEYQQLQLPRPDHPEDGHTDVVYGVQLRGDHLVSVSADKTCRIWDLQTRRSLRPALTGHTGSVVAVQFDPAANSDVIITGDADGNVMVWRFSTGEVIKTIAEAHHETVLCLCFDHKYLLTGGRDGKIKLWNRHALNINSADIPQFAVRPAQGDRYQEYNLLATFDGHGPVNALKLRDDVLISGSGDSTMCIWSLKTGELLQKVNIHQSGVACVQHNGRFIVSGSTDNAVKIYDINRKEEVASLEGHTNLVRCVQAVFDDSAEVQTIISGSYDGSIRVWEQEPGSREWRTQHQIDLSGFVQPDEEAADFGSRIFSVDFDANRFVCSGQGPVIRIWDFRSPTQVSD